MSVAKNHPKRIVIAGAGAAGLTSAFVLAARGAQVTVLDAGEAGRGALWASGGMLAAGFETTFELDVPSGDRARLFAALAARCARIWPEFAAKVEQASGLDVGYRQIGALTPARDPAEADRLEAGLARAQVLGVEVERLSAAAMAVREPGLAPARFALRFPMDGQVDNRRLAEALIAAVGRLGGAVRSGAGLAALDPERGEAVLSNGERLRADSVILATGAAAGLAGLAGVSEIEPVKGQMLSLRAAPGTAPAQVIRALDVYLAAKPDGRVVIGATSEPGAADLTTDSQAIEALKARAIALAPGLARAQEMERWAGLRPRARGGFPLVGLTPASTERLRIIAAVGGYRNGVLLAPAMAEAAEAAVMGEDSAWPVAFMPNGSDQA
ncbi:MAG: FAD-dependent oxidoreductase [Pseudomonadota bacterium]